MFALVSMELKQASIETDAKAAFIINFTKYIEWQSSSLDNMDVFKIGVVGDHSVYQSLKSLSSKKVKNKKIEIYYFNKPDDIQECHLIYVSSSMTLNQLKSCSTSAKSKNTLIIGDKKGALNNGAAINFVAVGNKLKFEMNIQNFNKNKLKVSSQLLQLATNVYE